MADPDPMSELEGIHRALRGIQFTLSVFLFVWMYDKLGELGGEAPAAGRLFLILLLWVPYTLVWQFTEMVFNARRLKKWW